MRSVMLAAMALFLFTAPAHAQDEGRRCCDMGGGIWVAGSPAPEQCRALGEDFVPEGDPGSEMCLGETQEGVSPTEGPDLQTGNLDDMRFDYDIVGEADLPRLVRLNGRLFLQRDYCEGYVRYDAGSDGGGLMDESGRPCFTNLRSNAHLVAQNAGRMRNDRALSAEEREEAADIQEQASEIRAHADALLGRAESRE